MDRVWFDEACDLPSPEVLALIFKTSEEQRARWREEWELRAAYASISEPRKRKPKHRKWR